MRILFVLLAAGLASAQAQTAEPTSRDLSMAAGYKAQFVCSGLFSGGKSLEAIEEDELRGIYPGYEETVGALPAAKVNRARKTVSVRFAEDMPPRIAVWRQHLGCASLPPGSMNGNILPRIELERPTASDEPWPQGEGAELRRAAITELDRVLEETVTGAFGGSTSAVVVIRDGELVGEQYKEGFGPETAQRTWSVAKSLAATVIGAAVHQGILEPDQPTGLSAWSAPGDPRQAITLENLLHMASGLDSEPAGNRTDEVYFGGGLVSQHAVEGALQAPPGTRWRYANNDTMLAMLTLRERMEGRSEYLRFPFEAVLHKIGMLHTYPETDWRGDYVMSSQVWTTARDLARLGQLYLQDGVWEGERILPEGWAEYVSTPAPSQPPRRGDGPSRGYGVQFWLYEGFDGVPEGSYAALGNRGQVVMIVPERNAVIVRRGYDSAGNRIDIPAFTAAVLEALE
ncbi:serine hydrolase domain-containing protein [Parvularcula maris]|uniref:Beta-lactamase family protein n=1 Tax=Parvularcula maris TaxID=2965077 RepID=A0A9X2LA33_9PROT|nr:serine hydrolase [Parvularcula maris]MCQ8185756.1 beta-lactamase family protein [Parvularcula maris]